MKIEFEAKPDSLSTPASFWFFIAVLLLFLLFFSGCIPVNPPISPEFSCLSVNEIPQRECEALVALYESTNGPEWDDNTGWLETPTPCSWHGVTCSDGYVTRLVLWDNSLEGQLPEELGDFLKIESIFIQNNLLDGTIPEQIGNLTNLRELVISRNQITGEIPSSIGQLRNLTLLDLEYNQLSGEIPPEIGRIEPLLKLKINENQLTGYIPPELGQLSNIKYLRLNNNDLYGSLPPSFGDFSDVTYIDLSNNTLIGSIPNELGNLTNLHTLKMSHNNLSGGIPEELVFLQDISFLWLDNNDLIGSIPRWLGSLSNIHSLNLSNNRFTGTIPIELGNLSNMGLLRLQNNSLEGRIPTSLTQLPLFRITHDFYGQRNVVDFGFNMLHSDDSSIIDYLEDRDPDWFETQTIPPSNLQVVNIDATSIELSWTPITYTDDDGGYQIGIATSSSQRYRPYTELTSDKTVSTIILNSLEPEMNFWIAIRTHTATHGEQQNDLWSPYSKPVQVTTFSCVNVDQIPQIECEALVAFFVSTDGMNWNNRDGWLNDHQPCGWFGVTCEGWLRNRHVVGLKLEENNLEGSIPREFANLIYLRSLNVAKNRLFGSIQAEICNLSELEYLDISENRFFGEIPSALGNLTKLDRLHLENNAFYSEIPRSLINLFHDLSELYLSYNMLYARDVQLMLTLVEIQPDWYMTQTIAPSNLSIESVTSSNVELVWSPINYTEDDGGYEIGYSTSNEGDYTVIGSTTSKMVNHYTATGLSVGESYYFSIRTHTFPHDVQQNDLVSPWSEAVGPFDIPFRCQDVTEIPGAECEALKALFEDTRGEGWTRNRGWLKNLTPCSWFGVTCRNRQVSTLNLSNNNLSGSLPPEIGNLSKLVTLILSENQIAGTIPTQIDGLAILEYLSLSHNELNGDIPTEMWELNTLRSLYLDHNHFEGRISRKIDQLANLRDLDLSANCLSNSIPEAIGGLDQLISLRLAYNALEGNIPLSVVELVYLNPDQTDFGYNMLSASSSVSDFLDYKDDDWMETQTVPPRDLRVTLVDSYIQFFWAPILYQSDQGGYEISYSQNHNGDDRVSLPESANKTPGRHEIDQALLGSGSYYFWIRTHTAPHDEQENDLWSAYALFFGPITIP